MTDAPAPPPTVEKIDGVRRLVGRRLGQLVGTVLLCPEGKRRSRVIRPGDSHFAVECTHEPTRESRLALEHWLYLLPRAGGGTLVVECHVDEVIHIQRARLTLDEIRAYLEVDRLLTSAA